MSDHDPILALESFGYTGREASFVYLVGIHSGYFLRRQFLALLQREDGAMVQRFLSKSERLGHVQAIAYQQGRHIYHLKSKAVYGLLGEPDSQSRREKGDRQIKLRLMQLDYVIEHFGQQFLETGQRKAEFFHEKLHIPLSTLPRFSTTGTTKTLTLDSAARFFPDRSPITVEERLGGQPLVTFTYIDEGMRTVSAFKHWLDARVELLRSLSRPEVVYVSDVNVNFDAAEHEFLRRFPLPAKGGAEMESLPLGVEHLIRYLHVRRKADDRSPLFWDEMGVLSEGEKLYRKPPFEKLVQQWRQEC